jgi:hypothetical protein
VFPSAWLDLVSVLVSIHVRRLPQVGADLGGHVSQQVAGDVLVPLVSAALDQPMICIAARSGTPSSRKAVAAVCRCRCRKVHPCWSGCVMVFVEGAAESITSSDVEVVELVWFADGLGE